MNTNNSRASSPDNLEINDKYSPQNSTPSRHGFWKTGFFVVLVLWLMTLILAGVYLWGSSFINNDRAFTKAVDPTPTSVSSPVEPSPIPTHFVTDETPNYISARVELYRIEDDLEEISAIFKITNLNNDISLKEIRYWTDKTGSCEAQTVQFSEFIEIPLNEIDQYSFFQFIDDSGNNSEIYASSSTPIFQCGALAE